MTWANEEVINELKAETVALKLLWNSSDGANFLSICKRSHNAFIINTAIFEENESDTQASHFHRSSLPVAYCVPDFAFQRATFGHSGE